MKKIGYLLLFVLCGRLAVAQTGLQSLIAAEQAFAADAKNGTVKAAFLKHMHPSAVVFQKGEVLPARQTWEQRPDAAMLLLWQPQFAEIAKGEDFGYTTGPYRLCANGRPDSVLARGQYTTLWQKGADGNWKFLVDMGTRYHAVNEEGRINEITVPTTQGVAGSLMDAEKDWIIALKQGSAQSLNVLMSEKVLLNHDGFLPQTTKEKCLEMVMGHVEKTALTPLAYGLAQKGDLAYVYGLATRQEGKGNYLHIWRHEAKGWRLALEVLSN